MARFTLIVLCALTWFSAVAGDFVRVLSGTDTVPLNTDAGHSGIHIIFPCNKTYFYPNQESWRVLNETLDSISVSRRFTLEAIHLYGAASPEGPYDNNVYLSVNRAQRVIDSLKVRHPNIDFGVLASYNVPEDYERLAWVTRNDSVYAGISGMYGANDFETKKNLQKNPAMWSDLLKRYYPGLRAVNALVYVRKNPVPVIVIPEPPLLEVPQFDPVLPDIVRPVRRYCWSQPMLRLKTNLIYDAGCTPNISLEFLPRTGHVTLEVRIIKAEWRNDRSFRTWIIRGYEAGARYYIKGDAAFTGFYIGAAAGTGVYDIQLSKNRAFLSKKYAYNWKVEISAGYVKRLGNSGWTVEGSIGLGCIYSRYDPYHGAEDWATPGQFYYDWHAMPEDFRKYAHVTRWWGPVNLNFSISYDILKYKKKCVEY